MYSLDSGGVLDKNSIGMVVARSSLEDLCSSIDNGTDTLLSEI